MSRCFVQVSELANSSLASAMSDSQPRVNGCDSRPFARCIVPIETWFSVAGSSSFKSCPLNAVASRAGSTRSRRTASVRAKMATSFGFIPSLSRESSHSPKPNISSAIEPKAATCGAGPLSMETASRVNASSFGGGSRNHYSLYIQLSRRCEDDLLALRRPHSAYAR
jgi:hypothetical protein